MNAAYAHLLQNHVPVYAEIVGAVALLSSVVRRTERGRDGGLIMLVAAGVFSIPTFVSGKLAAPIVKVLPGVQHATMWAHHHASLDVLYATLGVGVVALATLLLRRRAAAGARRATFMVVLGSLVAAGLEARAAQLGGRIRHGDSDLAVIGPQREQPKSKDMAATKDQISSLAAGLEAAFPKSAHAGVDPVLPGQSEGDFSVDDFHFASGEQVPAVRLHYTTLGTPHRDASGQVDNAVLLLHGTMGRGKAFLAPAFSDAMFGAGQPFDVSHYFVVLPDAIGHGASSKPSDGLHGRFPHYGYTDMVELQRLLLADGLGIHHVRIVAGTSMGGMHTWLWCTRYPNAVDVAIPIAANPSAVRGRNLAWRRLIIEATTNDPEYRGGDYDQQPYGYVATLPLFQLMIDSTAHLQRALPDVRMTTDFVHGDFGPGHPPVDANDAIYALDASRDYDPSSALEMIRSNLLAIQFADDEIIVPALRETEALLARVPHAKRVVIAANASTRGHSTLGLAEQWRGEVTDFLRARL